MSRNLALLCLLAFLPSCQTTGANSNGVVIQSNAVRTVSADIAPDKIIRIVTPFANPGIVTNSTAEIQLRQNVLYLFAPGEEAIEMFVTDAGDESAYVDLTLTPKLGGARNVDATIPQRAVEQTKVVRPASNGYVSIEIDNAFSKVQEEPLEPYGKPCRLCRKDDSDRDEYDGKGRW